MPWEKQYDTNEVVDRAMRLFWARGYESTSITDLIEATGINRGSLYAGFGDKRGLFLESLRRYDMRQREQFLARLARTNPPREAILAAFAAAARSADDTPGGCLLVNTAMELAPHDPEIRELVDTAFASVREFFERMIRQAQAQGTIGTSHDAHATAQALLGLFLGLRVLNRAQTTSETRDAVASRARMLLE